MQRAGRGVYPEVTWYNRQVGEEVQVASKAFLEWLTWVCAWGKKAGVNGFLEMEMIKGLEVFRRAKSRFNRNEQVREVECKNLESERRISEVQDFEQVTNSEWKQYWNRENEMDIGLEKW